LKKGCYKVAFCEYCQRHTCKAFTVLFVRAKMVRADVPCYVKMWPKLTIFLENTDLHSIFARSASDV